MVIKAEGVARLLQLLGSAELGFNQGCRTVWPGILSLALMAFCPGSFSLQGLFCALEGV